MPASHRASGRIALRTRKGKMNSAEFHVSSPWGLSLRGRSTSISTGPFFPLQLEPELFPYRFENIRTGQRTIACTQRSVSIRSKAGLAPPRLPARVPLKNSVTSNVPSSPVASTTGRVERHRESLRQHRHRPLAGRECGRVRTSDGSPPAALRGYGRVVGRLSSSLGRLSQRSARTAPFVSFEMRRELEALSEQVLEHQLKLLVASAGGIFVFRPESLRRYRTGVSAPIGPGHASDISPYMHA